jgi:hypothetical protein
MHFRAAVHCALATGRLRSTDEVAVFGTHPLQAIQRARQGFSLQPPCNAAERTRGNYLTASRDGSRGGFPRPVSTLFADGALYALVAADDAQPRPVLLRREDPRLPVPGQILEAVGVE